MNAARMVARAEAPELKPWSVAKPSHMAGLKGRELAGRDRLPMPQVAIVDDPTPNVSRPVEIRPLEGHQDQRTQKISTSSMSSFFKLILF